MKFSIEEEHLSSVRYFFNISSRFALNSMPGFHWGRLVSVRHLVTDLEEQLRVLRLRRRGPNPISLRRSPDGSPSDRIRRSGAAHHSSARANARLCRCRAKAHRLWKIRSCPRDKNASLGFAVRNQDATLALRRVAEHIVQVRVAVADVFDVARFSPDARAIDVDVGERFLERIERMSA